MCVCVSVWEKLTPEMKTSHEKIHVSFDENFSGCLKFCLTRNRIYKIERKLLSLSLQITETNLVVLNVQLKFVKYLLILFSLFLSFRHD